MTWKVFGFGGTSGGGAGLAGSLKVNQPVTTGNYQDFTLNTSQPIVSNSLQVFVNGIQQVPVLDFKELPDGKSFSWVDSVNPLGSKDYISTSFLIA